MHIEDYQKANLGGVFARHVFLGLLTMRTLKTLAIVCRHAPKFDVATRVPDIPGSFRVNFGQMLLFPEVPRTVLITTEDYARANPGSVCVRVFHAQVPFLQCASRFFDHCVSVCKSGGSS